MAKAPPRPQPRKPSNVTRAVILMAASTGVMSATHVAARWLSQDLHPFEVAFFRNAAALLVLTPLVMRQGLRAFRSARPGLQTAPLAAEVLSGLVLGAPVLVADDLADALHPARFLIRELKKKRR